MVLIDEATNKLEKKDIAQLGIAKDVVFYILTLHNSS
jgi:hypothetical protein